MVGLNWNGAMETVIAGKEKGSFSPSTTALALVGLCKANGKGFKDSLGLTTYRYRDRSVPVRRTVLPIAVSSGFYLQMRFLCYFLYLQLLCSLTKYC